MRKKAGIGLFHPSLFFPGLQPPTPDILQLFEVPTPHPRSWGLHREGHLGFSFTMKLINIISSSSHAVKSKVLPFSSSP